MPNTSPTVTYINNAQAAKIAKVSTKTIRNWRTKDKFDWFKHNPPGGKPEVQIEEKSFLRYLKERESPSPKPPPRTETPPPPIEAPLPSPPNIYIEKLLEEKETRIAEKDQQIDDLKAEIQELKATIKEQKVEIKTLQEYQRHYQERKALNWWNRIWVDFETVEHSQPMIEATITLPTKE